MYKNQLSGLNWYGQSPVSVNKYFIFASIVLIVTFSWMEPSGASGIGFWKGLFFWTIQISILIPLLVATQLYTANYFQINYQYAPWIQTALAGLIGSIIFVPLAYYIDLVLGIPEDSPNLTFIGGLLDEATGVIFPVTMTWVALNSPWIFQLDFSKNQSAVVSKETLEPDSICESNKNLQNRFIHELKSRAKGELISISSELHYLRVNTTDKEVMFLYNLKDAINEIPPDSGVRIHRSHWISRAHLVKITKVNGIAKCILSNGKVLPISRRNYSVVKKLIESR